MTKNEFLKLFELENIFLNYEGKIPFSIGLREEYFESEVFVFFGFEENEKIQISIELLGINKKEKIELPLLVVNNEIILNNTELFKNEIFPFLDFKEDIKPDLKFLADYISEILKNKYKLIMNVHIH